MRELQVITERLVRYSPKHTMLEPTASAMNCYPPTVKVIGEVLMVAFSGDLVVHLEGREANLALTSFQSSGAMHVDDVINGLRSAPFQHFEDTHGVYRPRRSLTSVDPFGFDSAQSHSASKSPMGRHRPSDRSVRGQLGIDSSPETAVQIDLSPCSPDDRDFVFRVTEEAMRAHRRGIRLMGR